MRYTIIYRGELMAREAEADSPSEAVEKLERGDYKLEVLNELHKDFIQVFDENDKEVFQKEAKKMPLARKKIKVKR